jgi:primosomal protein N' (replication factor Y) (superfamily II helicase)
VVRVVPDVAGIAKAFDYLVPPALSPQVQVGTSVRVLLHNRRVSGWVVEDRVTPPPGVELRPLLAVRGWGPPPAVVEMAQWTAWRWAGPLSHVLGTASPPTLVRSLPAPPPLLVARLSTDRPAPTGDGALVLAREAMAGGTVVVRLAPAYDPYAIAEAAARHAAFAQAGVVGGDGMPASAVVLAASRKEAQRVAAGMRRAGHRVALLPEQWAAARAGGVVAVGTRAAAFAPVPSLSAAVVFDAHDQAYQEERAPTYRAWEVLAERARREGARCALISACPSLELLEAGRLVTGSRLEERAGWPSVEVVDRRGDDPRSGLYSPRLVELVRWAAAGAGRRVVCVLNRTGRARLLVCGACGELARCSRCGAAVEESGDDGGACAVSILRCRRCGTERPVVCDRCSSAKLRALRIGVSRARQELEALAGTSVAEVSASDDAGDRTPDGEPDPERAAVVVGTEAVLHRLFGADAVAFLDFDSELLAPRLGAGEQALALLARAARVVAAGSSPGAEGAGRAPGKLLIQTRQPQHPAVLAAVAADPGLLAAAETPVRVELGLPPLRAWALLSGAAADAYGRALAAAAAAEAGPALTAGAGTEVRGPHDGVWSILAPDHRALADLLASVPRPPGRLRVEVDPARA